VSLKTRYARNGDVSLAYQEIGDGPRDLLLTTGWVLSMESIWEDALYSAFVERLASISRVILWDKRGTGLSDRVPAAELPTLEQRIEDLSAVLDASDAREPALFGLSEGSLLSALFAATHPERVSALILYGSWASSLPKDDSPGLMGADEARDFLAAVGEAWGDSGGLLQIWAPSVAEDARVQDWWNRALTAGASPSAALAWLEMTAAMDIRAALPAISAPTLIVHRSDDHIVPVENGRYLAAHIPHARYVELGGEDHLWWFGDRDALLDEVEELLTGAPATGGAQRALMTVLFTDLVDSTKRAAELGDRGWRDLNSSHEQEVRTQLDRFRGRAVKTMGDGFLATFDGPARAIRCACAIRGPSSGLALPVRAGLHAGECELIGDDIGGIAVNIGARVGALAGPGEVLVSSTVKDLVIGSGIEFADRGAHELRGVPGEWHLFAVTAA
jgi:pimeloyl-ACP methyl ester carboxylesterase/class 3 adenylate cyclase